MFDTSKWSKEQGSKANIPSFLTLKYWNNNELIFNPVDKLEQMLGSYGPSGEAYTKNFDPEESPSGILARSGTYNVKSRVIDDDGEVYAGLFLPIVILPLIDLYPYIS